MRNKKLVILGASLSALPVVSARAATVTYQYYNIKVGTSLSTITTTPTSTLTSGVSLTGTGAAEVLTVPVGDYVTFGLQVDVTNNGGAGLYAANLGINASTGSTSSSIYSATSQAPGTLLATAPGYNSVFTGVKVAGYYDGAGGISAATTGSGPLFEGFNSASANENQASFAAGTFSSLISKETITAKANGVNIFTPVQINGGTGLMTAPSGSPISGTPSSGNYGAHTFGSGDFLTAMPTLTVVVGTGSASSSSSSSSSSSASGHSIISLTNTQPASYYGSQIGSPILLGGGHSGYVTSNTGANSSGGTTTGYTTATGWNPLTDTEIFALKLNYNGSSLTPSTPGYSTLISEIVTDLNANSSNVSASAITGTLAGFFPTAAGWDILLTSTSGFGGAGNGSGGTLGQTGTVNGGLTYGGESALGIDFSQDTDAATGTLTVTEIAAVPEPATAAGIVIGAAGLLLGRRKVRAIS